MDFEIVRLPKGNGALLGKIVQDDLVSRQTIIVRDSESLGIEGDDTLIIIEGSREALDRAVEITGDEGSVINGTKKSEIYRMIREAEENAAEGLGLMFG